MSVPPSSGREKNIKDQREHWEEKGHLKLVSFVSAHTVIVCFSFFTVRKSTWVDIRAHAFNVCWCTINCLGMSRLFIYLFPHSSRSESDGKEGYHDWTRLQRIFFMWDNVCQPSQPSVSTEESLKNPVCTLPSGQTHFSCCYPSHDYSSTTTTNTTTATLVSNKQKEKQKLENKTMRVSGLAVPSERSLSRRQICQALQACSLTA